MNIIPVQFNSESLRRKLQSLSLQEGHYGTIDVDDVVTIVELRENRIAHLLDRIADLEVDL